MRIILILSTILFASNANANAIDAALYELKGQYYSELPISKAGDGLNNESVWEAQL